MKLQTTDNKGLNTQTTENKKNLEVQSSTTGAGRSRVGRSFENLSTTTKSAKSKKPKLTKSKKLDLVKANSSGMDFHTFGAKKVFIYL